jgi:hypothetical protein
MAQFQRLAFLRAMFVRVMMMGILVIVIVMGVLVLTRPGVVMAGYGHRHSRGQSAAA